MAEGHPCKETPFLWVNPELVAKRSRSLKGKTNQVDGGGANKIPRTVFR